MQNVCVFYVCVGVRVYLFMKDDHQDEYPETERGPPPNGLFLCWKTRQFSGSLTSDVMSLAASSNKFQNFNQNNFIGTIFFSLPFGF